MILLGKKDLSALERKISVTQLQDPYYCEERVRT
jgi:hypothetical protein